MLYYRTPLSRWGGLSGALVGMILELSVGCCTIKLLSSNTKIIKLSSSHLSTSLPTTPSTAAHYPPLRHSPYVKCIVRHRYPNLPDLRLFLGIGNTPLNYLRLPDPWKLLNQQCLTWCLFFTGLKGNLLQLTWWCPRRLAVINSPFTSMAMFVMCSIQLLPKIIQHVKNKIRRHYCGRRDKRRREV